MSQINISIELKAPELATALLALADAWAMTANARPSQSGVAPDPAPAQPVPMQSNPAPAPTPAPAPAQTYNPSPAAPAQMTDPILAGAPAPAVPVTPQSYTLDQLAQAATQLMDAGRRNELISLLSSYSVQALTALPKEQYGAFATQLRAMGARI